jgi:hypothetical protein
MFREEDTKHILLECPETKAGERKCCVKDGWTLMKK